MPCLLAPWLEVRSTVALIRGPEAETASLALGIALAVAGGRAFSGFMAPRAFDVLYLSDHEDAVTLRTRMDALGPAVTPPLDDDARRRVQLLTVADGALGLGTVAELSGIAERTVGGLVILDCSAPPTVVEAFRSTATAVIRLMTETEARYYPLGRVGQVVRLKQTADGLRLVWSKPNLQELPVTLAPPPHSRVHFGRICR